MNKTDLIEHLQLEPHIEGGYFRRSYQSPITINKPTGEERPTMTAIYYMLTDDSPIGYFHQNRSDILHIWQAGSALTYFLISPEGLYRCTTLGPNIKQGEQLQLTVPAGTWKATHLQQGEYGLITEAVAPGFDYADMKLAKEKNMLRDFPQLWQQHSLSIYCKE